MTPMARRLAALEWHFGWCVDGLARIEHTLTFYLAICLMQSISEHPIGRAFQHMGPGPNPSWPLVIRIATLAALSVMLTACRPSGAPPARFVRTVPWAENGVWLKADTHVHTSFSDGGVALAEVVDRAVENGCHVIAITDHGDADRQATSDEYFAALEAARKKHPKLILLAGLEWNVPPWGANEHATLLLPPNLPERQILREFQVLFDDWQRTGRDPDLALKALDWLARQAPPASTDRPVVIYNHPCRKRTSSATFVEELGRWRQSSDIAIGFEGGPGHQDSDPIGAYKGTLTTIDRWDPAAAELGGAWDQLLARGLPVWGAVATSDFHQGDPTKPDDYWPGEFSETWLYAPQHSADGALAALRAGSFFGVHGHIAQQVQLRAYAAGLDREAIAGEAIHAAPGSELLVTLHLELPIFDWQDGPNRIDEVELIGITASASKVIARRTPTTVSALRMSLLVPEGGLALRARGRRDVQSGPDLLFYTNPIQVFTDVSPGAASLPDPSAVLAANPAQDSVHASPAVSAPDATDSRHVPAWIPLGFVVAASLLTSLIDRWQFEIRQRFTALGDRTQSIPQEIPRGWRRYFLALLAGFVFLAVYGSLVPLRPVAMDWSTALGRFATILQQPVSMASRSDWATNVLLFVPIGFLATGLALGARPGNWRRGLGIVLVVVACAALSLAIEFSQLWVADRTSSQNDVVAETLGSLIGGTSWLFLGPVLIGWLSRVMSASRPRERIEHLLEAYVAFVALYMLLPLDLTLRPAELYDKLQDGRINLIPFADLAASPAAASNIAATSGRAIQLLGDLLLLVPLGMLTALWRWPAWERVRPLVPSLTAGLLIVGAIEAAQLLVVSRYSSTTDLLSGGLGVLLGWLIADQLVRANASRSAAAGLRPSHGRLLLVAAATYGLFVAALLCLPFDHWATAAEVSERLHQFMTRLPLTSLYWGTELHGASELLRKLLLGAPLGGILALALRITRPAIVHPPASVLGSLFFFALWACGIEFVQVWLPPHIADWTDSLLLTAGAGSGLIAVHWLLRSSPQPAAPPLSAAQSDPLIKPAR